MIQEQDKKIDIEQLSNEESESLLSQNENKNQQQFQKKIKKITEKEKDNQVVFEKMCILFVIGALFIVLLIICGILISTFKDEEMQRYQEKQQSSQIITPLTDQKQYKQFLLANKLKVLLVSDINSDNSYAAIDVNVGSWQEPENINGLAHFLEHMLFLASEKYNDTAYFDTFLSLNGGFSNAYTSDSHTNYFFKVKPSSFDESLKIFAQMFISPLFLRDQGNKEAQNVENEYQIDVGQDAWMLQNFISLICKPDHPMSRFTVGTVETLITQPQQEEIDVYDQLSQFFQNYYSSNVMSLIIYSNHPFEQLEQYIENADFQQIKNKDIQKPSLKQYGMPIENDNLQTIYKLQTNSGVQSLEIIIQLDSIQQFSKKRSLEYIQFMLTYPGKNGFYDIMIQQGFLIDISQSIIHDNDAFTLLQVSFVLTDLGFKIPGTILKAFYAYMDKVSQTGINEEYYDQLEEISLNKFNYNMNDDEETWDLVSQMANYLNSYPSSEVLISDYSFDEFDQIFIQKVVNDVMNTSNAFYVLCSNKLFRDGENIEFLSTDIIGQKDEFRNNENQFFNELYDIKYSQIKISDDEILQLKEIDELFFQFFQMIQLPKLNKYVPKNLEMVNFCTGFDPNIIQNSQNRDDEQNQKFVYEIFSGFDSSEDCEIKQYEYEKNHKYPQLIQKDVYYKLERSFVVPQINYFLRFQNQIPASNAKNQVLCKIIQNIVALQLERNMAEPLSAGYSFDIQQKLDGFAIYLEGWSDKFDEFSQNFFYNLNNLDIKQDQFNLAQEIVMEEYTDMSNFDPLNQAYALILSELILTPFFNYIDCIKELENINLDDSIIYYNNFLQNIKISQLILGNISPRDSQSLALKTLDQFQNQNIQDGKMYVQNLTGKNYIFRKYVDQQDDNMNSATINYYQVGPRTIQSYVYMKLLTNILNSFVYKFLRTDRDLGYVAFAQMVQHGCIDGFVIGFYIQIKYLGIEGSKEPPDNVDMLIEQSLFAFEKHLQDMSQDEFINLIESIKLELNAKQFNLDSESSYYFQLQQTEIPSFDQDDLALDILLQITLEDLNQQFAQMFRNQSGKISVQIYSKANNLIINSILMDSQNIFSGNQPEIIQSKNDLEINQFSKYECKINQK